MKTKKSSKANLENKKLLFKETGLILTLILVLAAFEWSTSEKKSNLNTAETKVIIDEDQVPITLETPPPPPDVPKEPVISDIIDIVDNDVYVENSILPTTEDSKLGIKLIDYVAAPPAENDEDIVDDFPYATVEEKPGFMGGDQADFTKWVFSRIVYPEIAKENGVQGRVTLQFTVNTDGSVSDIRILRGVDSSLDKEAVRVVSSSPKWTPGKQRGKPVKVRFTFPVIFQLK